jgi:hypothetical protein
MSFMGLVVTLRADNTEFPNPPIHSLTFLILCTTLKVSLSTSHIPNCLCDLESAVRGTC